MKKHFFLFFLLSSFLVSAQSEKNIAEKLGYSKDAKLLIIHADDIGVSHSENAATQKAMEKGMVTSGSMMIPCPWFPAMAVYAKENPGLDLGIHLTLTAEWRDYKWGPVLPVTEVPGLVNEQGFLYDNCADVVQNASVEEVEKEMRAQIERCRAFGVEPTHLDTHMGCLLNPKFMSVYLKLGREYNMPVMLSKEWFMALPDFKEVLSDHELLVDRVMMADTELIKEGMDVFYKKALQSIQPGVNVMLIHVAFDDAEMQAVTIDHPDFGANWRQQDFDFFTSDVCKEILKEQNIQLVTWKEVWKAKHQ